jgi:hypothetical protein
MEAYNVKKRWAEVVAREGRVYALSVLALGSSIVLEGWSNSEYDAIRAVVDQARDDGKRSFNVVVVTDVGVVVTRVR